MKWQGIVALLVALAVASAIIWAVERWKGERDESDR